jgi:serine/threonine protein kinase
MAADQARAIPHSETSPEHRETGPLVSSRTLGPDRFAAGMSIPNSVGADHLPALVELVKLDLSREWLQGRPVSLESYLKTFPELGTVESVSPELILAEYEVRCHAGESVELTQFEQRFPRQSGALRQLIKQQPRESATGSVLSQLGETAAVPQHTPLSLARNAKAAPTLPRRFGRYRVLEQLGQGAMGTVYLVRDTHLGRQVALKVPHVRPDEFDGAPDRRILGRFYREAHAAAILHHPNLCPVYDVGQINGIPYLTMAYIKGQPLSRYIDSNRPLPRRWVAALVRKLALALQAAHDKGVVHRDLKPSNVMMCGGREPMIMDFGLAWRLDHRDSHERLTRLGLVLGTPSYMSPEQLSGRVEDLGPRCDVYSLGVILYELLTGRCPFEGPEAVVLGQVLFVEPAPPSIHCPDIDPPLEAICLKAMAKRECERYASMSELASTLGEYVRRRNSARKLPSTTIAPVLPGSNDSQPDQTETLDEAVPCRDVHQWGDYSTGRLDDSPADVLAPAGLLKSWRRWTATVEAVTRGRLSRRSADRQAFRTLRNELLVTLRARAAEVQGPEREFYFRLEELLLPWMSIFSLAREDREILHDLLFHCQQAEEILKRRSARYTAAGWFAAVTAGLAAVSSLLFWAYLNK